MTKTSPHLQKPATGDDKIMELIFDNSALPVGRAIQRSETLADLGYEYLDFVELCVDLDVEFEEAIGPDEFGRLRVEEILVMARKRPVRIFGQAPTVVKGYEPQPFDPEEWAAISPVQAPQTEGDE